MSPFKLFPVSFSEDHGAFLSGSVRVWWGSFPSVDWGHSCFIFSSLGVMKQQKRRRVFSGIAARCRKEIADWGLVGGAGGRGGGLRWKGRKRRKKKDVPSALMWRLQHGSCSLQKEERDRANKQCRPDSAHLLQLPLPTRIKAEQGCRWSNTNTYGSCTHGPSLTIDCHQDQTGTQTGYFEYRHDCYGDSAITVTIKYRFYYYYYYHKITKKWKMPRGKNSLAALFLNKVQSGNYDMCWD